MQRISFFHRFLFLVAIVSLTSCAEKKYWDAALAAGKPLDEYDMMARLSENFLPSQTYIITDARIDGNALFLTVEFQASCSGKDVFEIIGLEAMNIDVYPPVRKVKLIHQPSSETCKETTTRTIVVNIRELISVKERDAETDLELSGWSKKLRYVYPP